MKKTAKQLSLTIIVISLLSSMCACSNDSWDGTIKFPKSTGSSDINGNISDIINSIEKNTEVKDIIDSIEKNTEVGDISDVIDELVNYLPVNNNYMPISGYHASFDNSIININDEESKKLEIQYLETQDIQIDNNISIYRDKYNNFYAHIIPWDAFYRLPESFNINTMTDYDCFSNDNAAEIVIKKYNHHVVTYRMSKGSSIIETNSHTFNILRDDSVKSFFNYYNEDCIYFFCSPEYYTTDSGESLHWPLLRYETTDGGKNWKGTVISNVYCSASMSEYFNLSTSKFVSKSVGIVNYYSRITNDISELTFITTDGGKTWDNLPKLQYPSDVYNRLQQSIDLRYESGSYILTIKCQGYIFQNDSIYVFRTLEYTLNDDNNWILTDERSDSGK